MLYAGLKYPNLFIKLPALYPLINLAKTDIKVDSFEYSNTYVFAEYQLYSNDCDTYRICNENFHLLRYSLIFQFSRITNVSIRDF